MGQPKFPRKQYDTPLHPWKEERIKQERELIKKYGLKNHKEVWRAKTFLGRYRQQARELLARMGSRDPQIKREGDQLLFHLTRMGILPLGSSLDDVLALEIESVLSRRLQTLVYLKGFSSTANQSRQLINHGHVKIGDRKVTIPGYLVSKDQEELIGYTTISPLNELSHPARPKTDLLQKEPIPPTEEPPSPKKETEKPEKKLKEDKKEQPKTPPPTPSETTGPKTPEPKLKEQPKTKEETPTKPPEKPKEQTPPKETKVAPPKPTEPKKQDEKPKDDKKEKTEEAEKQSTDEKKEA
jgi:small subunit ribosomal protein S4